MKTMKTTQPVERLAHSSVTNGVSAVSSTSARHASTGSITTLSLSRIATHQGTGLSIGRLGYADAASDAAGGMCREARQLDDGRWIDIPTFGNTHHFQRWRCAT